MLPFSRISIPESSRIYIKLACIHCSSINSDTSSLVVQKLEPCSSCFSNTCTYYCYLFRNFSYLINNPMLQLRPLKHIDRYSWNFKINPISFIKSKIRNFVYYQKIRYISTNISINMIFLWNSEKRANSNNS